MYALPGQSLDAWGQQLRIAAEYLGGHLSLYELTYKRGTKLFKQLKSGCMHGSIQHCRSKQIQRAPEETVLQMEQLTDSMVCESVVCALCNIPWTLVVDRDSHGD